MNGVTVEELDGGMDFSFLNPDMNVLVPTIVKYGLEILLALLIFAIGSRIITSFIKHERKVWTKRATNPTVVTFMSSLLKVILYIVLVLFILKLFGVQITSVSALVASSGLTIGLALQGSLANFAGGFLILVIHPFKVDDYIVEDTNKNEGFVVKIDLFYTTLRTRNGKYIMVPNGILANSSMVNYSAQGKIRVDIPVGISYHADIEKAREIAIEVLKNNDKVLKEEKYGLYVLNLGDSSVNLSLRCWTDPQNYWDTIEELTEEIKLAFDRGGITIPFPQLTISYEKDLEA